LFNNRAIATKLLNKLIFLLLAIAQVAIYFNAIQISIREYLSFLRSIEQDTISFLSREFRNNTQYSNSRNTIATI